MLPWEIGANESDETTKAFAVLTRTAPLSGSKPAHLERGFDVCTGTCCQIYRGWRAPTRGWSGWRTRRPARC